MSGAWAPLSVNACFESNGLPDTFKRLAINDIRNVKENFPPAIILIDKAKSLFGIPLSDRSCVLHDKLIRFLFCISWRVSIPFELEQWRHRTIQAVGNRSKQFVFLRINFAIVLDAGD